jgi:TPR repeat protein
MTDGNQSRDKRDFLRRIKEARIGNVQAQFEVALMYANGVGVTKSVEHALTWTQSAAAKGHVAAQYLLGRTYQQGLGVGKDPHKALEWYQRAADGGSDKAKLSLARLYAEPQKALAVYYAVEAAQAGNAEAQFTLGRYFSEGLGVQVDAAHACMWFSQAAEQGLASAEFALGKAYEEGAGVDADLAQACSWYRLAAAQGLPAAQLALERLDAVGLSRGRASKGAKRLAVRERRKADSRWIKFAAKGTREDFFNLGQMFEAGIGVEKSAKQARLWYQQAAELGHAQAMTSLAGMLAESNPDEAADWYLKAAELGDALAQHAIAHALAQGKGVNAAKDLQDALYWFAHAGRQEHTQSQWGLANLLHSQSDDLQKSFTMSAAHSGIAQAQYATGQMCEKGRGLPQDVYRACQWYQLAAEQGLAEAQHALGACFAEGRGVDKDIAKAFHWFELAAAQDHPAAQWSLGETYASGIPGVAQDSKQAAQLCKRAANAGFAPAQATLAMLFARAKKHQRAVHWWTLAAAQGDLEAQFNLSTAYRNGTGVDKDQIKSFDLLVSAAQAGLAEAQARLGLAYATGEGAVLDSIESAKWFILAANGGDAAAKANQTRAKKMLSPAQWTEACRRAKSWTPMAMN